MRTQFSMGWSRLFHGLLCLAFCLLSSSGFAQDRWTIQGQYLALNGKPVFLTGANYIPSTGWLMILENWNPEAVDRDMVALRKLGITCIRFPPLWPLLQPNIEEVSKEKLARLNQLVTIAHRNGIDVQVGPITGWMSGATFLPKWADGDIFTDARIIAGEQKLASDVARSLKDNPGLQGYDFGNEISAMASMMNLHPTPDQTGRWMDTIYQGFHLADPHHPVINGLGGFGGSFDIWTVAAHSDYLPVHFYPYFNRTMNMDPWIGQRTTYSLNSSIAHAAMTGKPVLVQEIGCSEAWVPKEDIAKFLRLTLMSAWAQGAAGYFWWGSHNIDPNYRVPTSEIAPKYSKPSFSEGIFDSLEYSMGLLDTHNQPKPYALEYQRWIAIIDKLGLGWKTDQPVCYLIHPEHSGRWSITMNQMTAFTLAKQIHMEVRMWPEGKPIPADAAAVVIANFKLSAEGKAAIIPYLEKGGGVYQSYESDFPEALTVKDSDATLSSPSFIANQAAGRFSVGEHVRIGAPLKLRDVSSAPDHEMQVLLALPKHGADDQPRPVFVKTSVGKGTYYYLAVNLEDALSQTYDPWEEDDSNLIYSVLRPESPVYIDSKYVELVVRTRGAERLFLLLNHSDHFQDVVLRSRRNIQVQDYATQALLGAGNEIPLHLMPGQVWVSETRGAH